jgi:hypothetical protein
MATKYYPPAYMQEGSTGPAANLVIVFLNNWAESLSLGPTGLSENGEYGAVAVSWMKRYQQAAHIDADGGFGPQTRQTAKDRDGFDFVDAAQGLSDLSEFVQTNGTIYYWAPGIDVTIDRHEAEQSLAKIKAAQ